MSGEKRGDFLRIDDLAEELQVSRLVLDKACQEYRVTRGRSGLPHCKLGRGFLFRRRAVERWVMRLEGANHA